VKFYGEGVKIYSHPSLHAKMFVFGDVAFVGSANVSNNSKNVLTEVVLKTDVRSVVSDAENFVRVIGLVELGREEILNLQKIYVAPRSGWGREKLRKKGGSLRIVHLGENENVPEDATAEFEKGEKKARKMAKARHESGYVWNDWGLNYKIGERLLFIQDDFMWSPSTVLFNQKVKGTFGTHFEKSRQNRKNLKKIKGQLSKKAFSRLSRQGVTSEEVSRELLKLWD